MWNFRSQVRRSTIGVVTASTMRARVPHTPCSIRDIAWALETGPMLNAPACHQTVPTGVDPRLTRTEMPPMTRKTSGATTACHSTRPAMRAGPRTTITLTIPANSAPGQIPEPTTDLTHREASIDGVHRAVRSRAVDRATFSPTGRRRQGESQAASSREVIVMTSKSTCPPKR